MRGQFQSFEPAPLTSSEESEGEFDYHRKYRRPYNRVGDTQIHQRNITLTYSQRAEIDPEPSNWEYRNPLVIKYVDDFIGTEKIY